MTSFEVNKYISLKLEDNQTNLYVGGELFIQCKFLMLNISVDKISDYDEVLSIDEAAELSDKSMEGRDREIFEIPPEAEFWAHCSNLQVWDEHNYDTRLLHSNLAFPLLRKLTEVGDKRARRVFKEEIAIRLESGYWPVVKFLVEGEFTDFLSREEFYHCILGYDDQAEAEITFLLEVEKLVGVNLDLERKLETQYGRDIKIENKRIVGISIGGYELELIPESIGGLKFLKEIYLSDNNIQELPNSIGNLENLEVLDLSANEIEFLPTSIRKLKSLKVLKLASNKVKEIPNSIGNLKLLEALELEGNQISSLPNSIGNLINLKEMNLRNNLLRNIPENVKNLKNLDVLNLSLNNFKDIPECIYELLSMKVLDLHKNKISSVSNDIKKLQNLKEIDLSYNFLKILPKSFGELQKLAVLNIYQNNLKNLPKEVLELKNLLTINLRNNPITKQQIKEFNNRNIFF